MIRDEFNQVEVKNNRSTTYREYGKTQKVEFSPHAENKAPEGELNEKYVGKTIKKVTEVNVEYVNKVQAHAQSTVVTTSTTATTAAAATASAAVAASTVAVVAIAAVTGISVGVHDYKYEFKSLIISSNELRYELYVYDALQKDEEYLSYEDEGPRYKDNDDVKDNSEYPFTIRVYNQNYDATQYIEARSANIGTFSHLKLGDSYTIVVSENRYGGSEIFKDSFVTYLNSEIASFEVSQYTDYVAGTFDYSLDFVDDKDTISDITLDFYEPETPERINASFSIPKEKGVKTISALDANNRQIIALDQEWGYRLTYMQNGEEKVFKEDTVAFEDYAGRKAVFNDFILSKDANFIENSITVTIDYIDTLGWYDNFTLIMSQVPIDDQNSGASSSDEGQYYTQEIPLRSVNTAQTIVLNEYEMYLRDSYFKYTYRLSCLYQGVETVLKEETTPFSFNDISGGKTEFQGFEINKQADVKNNSFKVKLSFINDFNALYSFTLNLYPSGVNAEYTFYLQETTEEQTLTFNENQHPNFSFDYTYTYVLTYWNEDQRCTYGENDPAFTFSDMSGAKSEFNGITFTGRYDISTGLAPVQLDYQDDYKRLSNFTLHLFGPITSQGGDINPFDSLPHNANTSDTPAIEDYPYAVALQKTTEVQYINLYESEIPISAEGNFLYAVTYNDRGVEQDPYMVEESIYFNDPDATSVVNGIIFVNGEANFNDRSFVVRLDFEDDFGYFSQFTLKIWDNTNGGWADRELEYTTEPQTVVIDDFDYEDYKYPVDIVDGDLIYNLTYVSSETGDPATQYLFEQEQPLSFTNSLKSEFLGLYTSFDFTSDENSGECRLPFKIDMINDAEYYSVPNLYIASANNEDEILASISFANEVINTDWQYGSFSGYNDFTIEDLTSGDEYKLVLTADYANRETGDEYQAVLFSENHVFTLNQTEEIYGISMETYIGAGELKAYFSIIANGDLSNFSNGSITFEEVDDGTTFIYDFTLNSFVTIDLMSPRNRTTTEQMVNEVFSKPLNITFEYSKPGSSEIITLNCYSGFQFVISA